MRQNLSGFTSILIVDDERFIGLALKDEIERRRQADQVVIAHNGFEALGWLLQQPFELLIVDYQMPEMNGVELARRVRKKFPQTQIILMSSYDLMFLQQAGTDVTLDGYLQKPFNLKQVFETIGALLQPQS